MIKLDVIKKYKVEGKRDKLRFEDYTGWTRLKDHVPVDITVMSYVLYEMKRDDKESEERLVICSEDSVLYSTGSRSFIEKFFYIMEELVDEEAIKIRCTSKDCKTHQGSYLTCHLI